MAPRAAACQGWRMMLRRRYPRRFAALVRRWQRRLMPFPSHGKAYRLPVPLVGVKLRQVRVVTVRSFLRMCCNPR